ncbi:MAG: UbiA family prenyltransferase [Sphingomonas sp.]|uniref:UbiA family prenyltransferase n=1 Tax=Sphingomonas sp. TaxID=28214 RepID=UPI001B19E23B|nr:UbiA family prenyltransferase [Sphingomonas sp.]MBO9622449.1 UbiA family prenyltransferase [Sphingomonas sp.]
MTDLMGSKEDAGGLVPLVVDVDGTLARTDLLHEAALQFVSRHPLETWRLFQWTLAGKVRLKAALAERVDHRGNEVPLDEQVVAAIRQAQGEGRPVYLASASHARYVEQIAERIGGIAGIFATDESRNLSGARKAECLNQAFGVFGYDYIGNAAVDFAVWHSSRTPMLVSTTRRFRDRVTRTFPHAQPVAHNPVALRSYLRLLRPHQWAKNLLLFLPLVAGHSFDAASILRAAIAFLCFCMAASSAYIINDLLDLPGDRAHRRKRLRPLASGAIPVSHGPPIALVLLLGALGGSLFLPPWFSAVLALYVALTLLYSLYLKRRVLIDVIALGALYTIRVLGGVAAAGTEESPWLMMFSLFLFLSLAVVKRCSELVVQRNAGKTATIGRGYRTEDLAVLVGLGAASGYTSVLVIALYIASPEVQMLYRHPERLWLICPLILYWISRVLLLSYRDELHDDPVVFALKDRASWIVGLCTGAVVAFAV